MPKPATPKPPRKPAARSAAPTFKARVDYVAKALSRGSWSYRFHECFEHFDGNHVIAAIMLRAQKNEALRKGLMASFRVKSWNKVPWHVQAEPFADMSAREISAAADVTRKIHAAEFRKLYRNPEKMLELAD